MPRTASWIFRATLTLGSFYAGAAIAQGTPDDRLLAKVIQAYQVKRLQPRPVSLGPKEVLGQALFFDPIVSGPRAISCATCHVRSKGAGDGLPAAVGLGAHGVADERLAASNAFLVPRNGLPFFNRGRPEFKTLFWDGRVQVGPDGKFETPLGQKLPSGFDSLLSAAAVFPLVEPDEMLGRSEEKKSNSGKYHQELLEDTGAESNDFQKRTLVVFDRLVARVVGSPNKPATPTQEKYRKLFAAAYPGVTVETVRIAHVGNALAAYIGAAFELQPAPWDQYVSGDLRAISAEQKRGALLFYGKGRCAVCHSGTQFSDLDFHGLAVPQLSVGKHGAFLDYGRAGATSRGVDRFKFRTPPLRNVSETGPWGHNGLFTTLPLVIEHHFNPVPALFKAQQSHPETSQYSGRLLSQRSPLLGEMSPLSASEVGELVSFLQSLRSPTVMSDDVALPKSVPSGDNQFIVR
jgi:cytochrome c peroxidase